MTPGDVVVGVLVGARETKVRPAVGIENDEASNEVVLFEKRVAR